MVCCAYSEMIIFALLSLVMLMSFSKSYVICIQARWGAILVSISCINLCKNVFIGTTCALTLTYSAKRVLFASQTKCLHRNLPAYFSHYLYLHVALSPLVWILSHTYQSQKALMASLVWWTASANMLSLSPSVQHMMHLR
jgi:hypothetical protein